MNLNQSAEVSGAVNRTPGAGGLNSSFDSTGMIGSAGTNAHGDFGHLSSSMRSMNLMSSERKMNTPPPNITESVDKDNLPITYRISWERSSVAFTITLIVPEKSSNANNNGQGQMEVDKKSPFQKIGTAANGKETHFLKIPLSFLVNASNDRNKSTPTGSDSSSGSAPWLDRDTLRARLRDGGSAIGLESSHIYQAIVAVEESATRMARWCPIGTEYIKADIILSEGFLLLVGNCSVGIADVNVNANINQNYSLSPSKPFLQVDFNYDVLNEKGSELFATSPTFKSNGVSASTLYSTGGLGLGNPIHKNNNNNNRLPSSMGLMNDRNSNNNDEGSTSFPCISNGLFASAPPNVNGLLSSSSYASSNPWENSNRTMNDTSSSSYQQGNPNGYINMIGQFGNQTRRHSQGQVQEHSNSMNMNGNSNALWTSKTPSNGRPVDATKLFSSLSHSHGANMNEVSPNRRGHGQYNNNRPDPNVLIEPMLAMGFNMMECEAAVNAIKNMPSMGGNAKQQQQQIPSSKPSSITLPPHMMSMQRQRSFSTTSSVSDKEDFLSMPMLSQHQQAEMHHHHHQRQLSGEDILGYVFNGNSKNGSGNSRVGHNKGNNIGSFEPRGRSVPVSIPPANSMMYDGNVPTESSNAWGHSHSNSGGISKVDDEDVQVQQQNGSIFSNGLWGNAGKMKVVKSENISSPLAHATSQEKYGSQQPDVGGQTQWHSNVQQAPKIIKMLDVPPELNAFVFHCNAQTRDECLDKGLFGCPSGGQYGPHSKAKKGDLLFLADFSAWTVTGIFTAKSDAGLNYDKTAWNGRFPWQIKVNPWSDLRTVHIDKVNEIIGLASGSKLNMLTKDQLLQLVTSKEFGPSVPPHLYKIKTVPSQKSQGRKEVKPYHPTNATVSTMDHQCIKYNRLPSKIGNINEHPATAMHRLKLVTSWLDSMAGEIVAMNELHNSRKTSPKKDLHKENAILDDLLHAVNICICSGQVWPLLTYSYVRRAIADVFDQWLFLAHIMQEKLGKNEYDSGDHESNNWIKQGGRSNETKKDVVLLGRVPGAIAYVEDLLQSTTGTSALAIPKEITSVLAEKIVSDIENISMEVHKTQASLMKMSGENYIKSIEDKTLGMKMSEIVNHKHPGVEEKTSEDTIVKIEWHTKSSISQGRPPQVQKIYKSHYNSLKQKYRNIAMGTSGDDPNMTRFLTRMFVLLCRYDLIGDIKNRCQAIVPLTASSAMTANFGVTHECFSSPLNHRCSSFNSSLFSDIDGCFGSLGSFFHFIPLEGSFSVNPPFGGDSLKVMFDHIFGVLRNSDSDRNALSFLVVIRGENSILSYVKRSQFCRRITTLENRYKYAMNTQHKDTVAASRMQLKTSDDISAVECTGAWSPSTSTSLLWLQNDFGHDLWTPSDKRVNQVLQGFRAHPTTAAIPV